MTPEEVNEMARAAHERIQEQVRTAPEMSDELLERIRRLLPPLPDEVYAAYADAGDIDLDEEVVLDSRGHRITEAVAEEWAEDAHRQVHANRLRGNPGPLQVVATRCVCPACGPISARTLHRDGCPWVGMSQAEIDAERARWRDYPLCPACAASAGYPCTSLRTGRFTRRPHPGRREAAASEGQAGKP